MIHALPTKPAFLGPPPATTTLHLLPPPPPSRPIASSSSSSSVLAASPLSAPPIISHDPTRCAICSSPPKYTCPRCSMRTCSLPCSTAHKEKYTCTGIRKAEGYVSLREYGQGEWAEDYRWLEEGRRKVEVWGNGVKEEELDQGVAGPSSYRDREASGRGGASRGRGGRAAPVRGNRSKTKVLRNELRARRIWAEFMPDGMGRRRLNQSRFVGKTKILTLSIQLSAPRALLAPEHTTSIASTAEPSTSPVEESDIRSIDSIAEMDSGGDQVMDPATLPDPPSSTSKPLAAPSDPTLIFHPRTTFAHPTLQPLPTLSSLLPPLSCPTGDIVLLLPFFPSPARPTPPAPSSGSAPRFFFPPLDPDLPIADVLKGTAYVEFPTIHLMSRKDWDRGINDGKMAVVPLAQPRKWGDQPAEGRTGDGAGKTWGGEQDAGWGKRARKPETGLEERAVKRLRVAPLVPVRADAALGALGAYASDESEEEGSDADGGNDGEEGGGKGGEEEVGEDSDDGSDGDGEEEDEAGDGILDAQPGSGSAASLLAGLPPDLLVAMSHAIEADLT